jgi:hypothetical protein
VEAVQERLFDLVDVRFGFASDQQVVHVDSDNYTGSRKHGRVSIEWLEALLGEERGKCIVPNAWRLLKTV